MVTGRKSGACALIPTGVKAKMEDDEFLMLVNRSSNPLRKGLIIPQGVGIIDADYYENDSNVYVARPDGGEDCIVLDTSEKFYDYIMKAVDKNHKTMIL